MKLLLPVFTLWAFIFQQNACAQTRSENADPEIQAYWSDGLAELSKFDLTQYRYGEARQSELIQVFVAEDFLVDKQVKNESYTNDNSTRVLKRIETRNFNTGIYTYNVYASSFTAFNQSKYPHTLKISASSQEWCGVSYSQLNRKNNGYDYILHSYFEDEADTKSFIKDGISEEELFSRIRLSPDKLPEGNFKSIPSQIYSRFMHLPATSYRSTGKVEKYTGNEFEGEDLLRYTVNTPSLNRSIEIFFEKKSPHIIVGWAETDTRSNNKTVARLTHQIKEAYWQLNGNDAAKWRTKLGLD